MHLIKGFYFDVAEMPNRLKDKSPRETISYIRSILDEMGILVIEHWNDTKIPNLFSVRIQIIGTEIGTNGKGATEELALASGYGEFIERLSNGLLLSSAHHSPPMTIFNSRNIDLNYITASHNIIDAILFSVVSSHENAKVGLKEYSDFKFNKPEKEKRMQMWSGLRDAMHDPSKLLPAAVFVDINTGIEEFLPEVMFQAYGSHGMAAGNSYKEAIVQGCSEIFERYCQRIILDEKLTPPSIPRHIIQTKFPKIFEYIENIEKQPEFDVILRDCSLGKGFPVFCICIINKDTHCFSVTFGSHPNPEVALERLFTEVLQGRTLRDVINRIGSESLPGPYNTKLLFKISMGNYPMEFWSDIPSYDFDETIIAQNFKTNDEAFAYIMTFCKKNNKHVFVRDAGYLGFPVVHVIIPGYSEILGCDKFSLMHGDTKKIVTNLLYRYESLSESEKELILNFCDFDRKIGLIGTAKPYYYINCPLHDLSRVQNVLLFLAKISFELKQYKKAVSFYGKIAEISNNDSERQVFSYLSDFCKLLHTGYQSEFAHKILHRFYSIDEKKINTYLALSPSKIINFKRDCELNQSLMIIADKIWAKSRDYSYNFMGKIKCSSIVC